MDRALQFIQQWSRTIVAAALIASVVDMILPDGGSKQMVRLVTGTIVLFVIASPLISVIGTHGHDFDQMLPVSGNGGTGNDVASEQMSRQLTTLIEALPDVGRADVVVVMTGQFEITTVTVHILIGEQSSDGIVPVDIDIGKRDPVEHPSNQLIEEVTTIVSLFAGVRADRVQVMVENRHRE